MVREKAKVITNGNKIANGDEIIEAGRVLKAKEGPAKKQPTKRKVVKKTSEKKTDEAKQKEAPISEPQEIKKPAKTVRKKKSATDTETVEKPVFQAEKITEEKAGPSKKRVTKKTKKTVINQAEVESAQLPEAESEPKTKTRAILKAKPITTVSASGENQINENIKTKSSTNRGKGKKRPVIIEEVEEVPITEPVANKKFKKAIVKKSIESIEVGEKDTKKKATQSKAKEVVGKAKELVRNNRKRTAGDDTNEEKPSKVTKSAPLNPTDTVFNKGDFDLSSTISDKKIFNLKISSWNVAGLRSLLKKDGFKFLEFENPDIFCLQEVKCTIDQLPDEAARIPGYHPYWLCFPGGYAGVAIYSKIMPIHVEYGIRNKQFDDVGRIITAEYEKFYLINVYVPNSGKKLVNLESRMHWEKLFQEHVARYDALKPVIICGDMNVSHKEIDLANPKTNTRNAGFTKEEREKMSELLDLGYVDTFRYLYPDQIKAYTFWTYMGNARKRNIGWRLDYFIVSQRIVDRVVDNVMRSQCLGSDHCPITLFMNF